MIDQNSQFQAILTAVGEAKQANADALGIPWTFSQMAVGDANDTNPFPDRLQTKLINERRRAPLNQLKPDPKNPGVIIAEQVIPESVGGFWIREIGLYDQDGDLVAVANCAPTYKPLMSQGSGRTQIIRMNLIVSSLANIVLKIDPSVVLATRQYVDERTYTYVPVQQGGGIRQTPSVANKIFIGYSASGDGRLRATVDGTDLGDIAFTPHLQALLDQILDKVPANLNTLKKLALAVGNDPEYAQNVNKALAGLQAKLGFNPVQQGGGIKQTATTANKVFIGYSGDGDGRLRATVDNTDLGAFAFTSNLQALLDQILDNTPANLNTLRKLALAVGNDPEYAQNVNKVLAKKADSATSLDGYGIAIATQLEAEAGVENSKPATMLRVAQYVSKVLTGFQAKLGFAPVQQGGGIGQTDGDKNKIFLGFGTNSRLKVTVDNTDLGNVIFDKQKAQEAEPGIIQLATIAEVQQGSSTLAAVTPKNLRMGFFMSISANGYIVFPTWMGSFMFQWGRFSLAANTAAQTAVTYPIPFGTVLHAWTGVDGAANDQIGTQDRTTLGMTVSKGSSDTAPRNGTWFAIGGAF